MNMREKKYNDLIYLPVIEEIRQDIHWYANLSMNIFRLCLFCFNIIFVLNMTQNQMFYEENNKCYIKFIVMCAFYKLMFACHHIVQIKMCNYKQSKHHFKDLLFKYDYCCVKLFGKFA